MLSKLDICNRALQKLGTASIRDLDEDTKEARAVNASFDQLRDAELRAHPWSFAVRRRTLSPLDPQPSVPDGYTAFGLPSDFLRLTPQRGDRDLQIEGRHLITKLEESAQKIRYIARIKDTSLYDPLFVEALAARIAMELNEWITQSNTKKQLLMDEYERQLSEARRANAIERPPAYPPVDAWIETRLTGV